MSSVATSPSSELPPQNSSADKRGHASPSSHSPTNSLSISNSRQRQAEAAQAASFRPSQQQVQDPAQEHIDAVLQSVLLASHGNGASSDPASSQHQPRQHHLNPNSAPYSSPNLYRPYNPSGSSNGGNSYLPYSPQMRSAPPSGSSTDNNNSNSPTTAFINGGYDYYYNAASAQDQSQSYNLMDSSSAYNPYALVSPEGFDQYSAGEVYGSPVMGRGSIGGGANGLGVGAMPFNPYDLQSTGGAGRQQSWMMASGYSPQIGDHGELANVYPSSHISSIAQYSYPLSQGRNSYSSTSSNGRSPHFRQQAFNQTNQAQIRLQQEQAGNRLRGGGGAARFTESNGRQALGFGAGMHGNGGWVGGSQQQQNMQPAVPRSPLLEDFRNNKARKWVLSDIAGYVVEFSKDQHGSRFIQQKLEFATEEERELVQVEVETDAFAIQTDVFGNYVVQKLLEFGTEEQRKRLAHTMKGNVLALSMDTYGCRAIQKTLEFISVEQSASLVGELEKHLLECVKSSNANHVIQKIISLPSPSSGVPVLGFVAAFKGNVRELCTHPFGCRVLQRCFEYLPEEQKRPLLNELHEHTDVLILDQFGNYVVQYVLERGNEGDRRLVIDRALRGNLLSRSRHKFASNVCEKALVVASTQDRHDLIQELMVVASLLVLLKDAFGNYVLQRSLRTAEPEQKAELIEMVRPLLILTRKTSGTMHSKHLVAIGRLVDPRPQQQQPQQTPFSPLLPSLLNPSTSTSLSSLDPTLTPSTTLSEDALVDGMAGLSVGKEPTNGTASVGA